MGAVSRDTKKTATMADISLYLTNVNVSVAQNMDTEPVGDASSLPVFCLVSFIPCKRMFSGCLEANVS